MLRALFLASLCFVSSRTAAAQTLSVLHIKVVLVDAERTAAPVARHVLLVSDNPASAPPRRVTTAANGTADVRLPPGNYTVESDQPVAFGGKAYQWTQTLDIVAGRDAVLELTADNAEVSAVTSAPTAPTSPPPADPSFLLPRWQDSVVVIWTPTVRASGSVIDARGLIATNQRVIGAATSVEVQLTPGIKVAASVLAADSAHDVAVLWIDPTLVSSVRPVPLGCAPAAPPVVAGQILFTIEAPLNEPKDMTSGTVSRVEPRAILSDFRLARGSEGGPVFTAGGDVVGITSLVDDKPASRRGDARVVRVDEVCEVVASAEKKMKGAAAPDGTLRPVDPVRPFPTDALKNSTQRRTDMSPYRMSSADFDLTFVTPVLTYRAREQADPAGSGPLMDFGNWSEYVADVPPVLLIRVTPKLVESFWTTVARGAAMTQGVSLPPIKRAKAGFSRMRAFCGDAEVIPIHPFKIEQHASESVSVYEGLYAFDPGALGPHCATVKLVLFSEKAPEKGDTRPIDPNVLQHVWQDFAAYRDLR